MLKGKSFFKRQGKAFDGAVLKHLFYKLQNISLVAVAQNYVGAAQLLYLFGFDLGIAAADRQNTIGIFCLGSSCGVSGLFIAQSRNGTGVYNIYIGLVGKIGDLKAVLGKKLFESLSFVLIYLAAQSVKCSFHKIPFDVFLSILSYFR